jgi:hypothetical protein
MQAMVRNGPARLRTLVILAGSFGALMAAGCGGESSDADQTPTKILPDLSGVATDTFEAATPKAIVDAFRRLSTKPVTDADPDCKWMDMNIPATAVSDIHQNAFCPDNKSLPRATVSDGTGYAQVTLCKPLESGETTCDASYSAAKPDGVLNISVTASNEKESRRFIDALAADMERALAADPAADDAADISDGATPGFAPSRTYIAKATADDESTYDVQFGLGDLVKASEDLPDDFLPLKDGCELDPQRDALLPVRLKETSTNSSGFKQSIRGGIIIRFPADADADGVYVVISSRYSEVQCNAPQNGTNITETVVFDDVAPDEERTHDMLLVIKNFYSPASPDGKTDVLDELFLQLLTTDTIKDFTGPGIDGERIPLAE